MSKLAELFMACDEKDMLFRAGVVIPIYTRIFNAINADEKASIESPEYRVLWRSEILRGLDFAFTYCYHVPKVHPLHKDYVEMKTIMQSISLEDLLAAEDYLFENLIKKNIFLEQSDETEWSFAAIIQKNMENTAYIFKDIMKKFGVNEVIPHALQSALTPSIHDELFTANPMRKKWNQRIYNNGGVFTGIPKFGKNRNMLNFEDMNMYAGLLRRNTPADVLSAIKSVFD